MRNILNRLTLKGAFGNTDFFDHQMGLLTPLSHVPHVFLSYTDIMSFPERWYNTAISLFDCILRQFVFLPGQNELVKKYFAHLEPLPSIEDLQKNISLTLVNTHKSILPPRPAMPGVCYSRFLSI